MKIAMFSFGFEIGGVERLFVNLANALQQQGHEVLYVVSHERGPFRAELSTAVRLVNLRSRVRSAFLPLRRIIQSEKPDLFLVGPDFPAVLAVFVHLSLPGSTKLVLTQHNYFDVDMRKSMGFLGKLVPWAVPILWKRADKVVAVSQGIRSFLLGKGVPASKLQCIYNPVDQAALVQKSTELDSAHREVLTWIDGQPLIMFLGRLTKVKNLQYLLLSFARLREHSQAKLILVGDGPLKAELQAQASALGLSDSVLLAGEFRNPYPILAAARMLVLSSFSEALPTVVIEALCFGKPVVTTPTGAKEILLEGALGHVLPDFTDVTCFSSAMQNFLDQEYSAESIAKCQERAAEFTMDKCLSQYLDLAKRLVARS